MDEGLRALDSAVAAVADTLSLAPGQALMLLAAHRWDPRAAVEAMVGDETAARTAAGLLMAAVDAPGVDASGRCGVCFEPCAPTQSLACGHSFCGDCWNTQVAMKAQECPQGPVPCMWPGCRLKLSEEVLVRVGVTPALLRRWRRSLVAAFLDSAAASAHTVHCRSPKCRAVIRVAQVGAVVCGECALAFCGACDYPAPHAPATCKMVADWQEKVRAILYSFLFCLYLNDVYLNVVYLNVDMLVSDRARLHFVPFSFHGVVSRFLFGALVPVREAWWRRRTQRWPTGWRSRR